MTQSNYVTAADYADALLTARRAKNVLFLVLLLCLLGQLALFFTARYSDLIVTRTATDVVISAPVMPEALPTTLPALEVELPDVASPTALPANGASVVYVPTYAGQSLKYLVGLTGYVGLVGNLVLGVVLLLLLAIMLVGRLVGVSRVTSAFIWSVVLLVLLFPWQAFLNNAGLFKVPGVLYTWDELVAHANFVGDFSFNSVLTWARFVGFPVVALVILIVVQTRSARGLKQALGEETPVNTAT